MRQELDKVEPLWSLPSAFSSPGEQQLQRAYLDVPIPALEVVVKS